MVATLLYTVFPRSKIIVPVATVPVVTKDPPVIPGITIAAKDITATETNRWTTAGRDAGNAGEQGEEGEGGLHPCWVEMALAKVHIGTNS